MAFNFRVRKMVWENFIPRWRWNERRRRWKKNEQHWLPVEYFLNCCKLNSIEIFWMTLKWFDTCIEVKWHKKNNLAPSVQIKWKKNSEPEKIQKAPNRFLDKWPNRHISVKFDKKTRKQPLFRCYHFGFDVAAIASYQYRIRARHLYRKMAARFNIIFRISYSVQLRPPCTNVATVATNEIRLYRLRTINQCERRVETTEIE